MHIYIYPLFFAAIVAAALSCMTLEIKLNNAAFSSS